MKQSLINLKDEIKRYFASVLLHESFKMLPDGKFKTAFSLFLEENIEEL